MTILVMVGVRTEAHIFRSQVGILLARRAFVMILACYGALEIVGVIIIIIDNKEVQK